MQRLGLFFCTSAKAREWARDLSVVFKNNFNNIMLLYFVLGLA
jgi:hypothetical protein